MATQTFTLNGYDTTSAAGMRAVGSQISSAITATGLTRTGDTGQINWSTVPFDPNSSSLGYEVWRFNDSAQSAAPIFISVNYGMSNGQLYLYQVQLGPSTNGAGVAADYFGASIYMPCQAMVSSYNGVNAAATKFRFNYNAAMGFFGMSVFDDGVGAYNYGLRHTYLISRACDGSGTPTTSGFQAQATGQDQNAGSVNHISFDASSQLNISQLTFPGQFGYTSLQVGTTVQFLRQQVAYPTVRTHPQVLYYATNDIPARGSQITLSPYGTSHTYITTGNYGTGQVNGLSASQGSLAMLWE